MPELVAATGSGVLGGFTLFQVESPTFIIPEPSLTGVVSSVISQYGRKGNCMPLAAHAECGLCPCDNLSKLMACRTTVQSTPTKPRTIPSLSAPMPTPPLDHHGSVKSVHAMRALWYLLPTVQIASKTPKGDLNITTRMHVTTVGAAPFFQRTAILHVVTNAICVLEPGKFYLLFASNNETH